jgi:quercetin dioxygenase-like cupin family protein
MNDLFSDFDCGSVARLADNAVTETLSGELSWHAHPVFAGVALKHLVTAAQTGGRFSAHLVRLEPGAEIGDHVHESSWELHEVAAGSGRCLLGGRPIDYAPGVAAVLPQDVPHSVRAGRDGLRLLAKFVPALL